jgi:hypothetical protein
VKIYADCVHSRGFDLLEDVKPEVWYGKAERMKLSSTEREHLDFGLNMVV